MNLEETMATLKKLGTAQNVKIYKRHGAGDYLFGVSFANLGKVKKQIKTDHDLAQELWKTGNADAKTLAIMIADPDQLTSTLADAWLREIAYYLLADLFSGLVAKSRFAASKLKKWTRSKKEFARQTGYGLVCAMLKDDPAQLDDEICSHYLETIVDEIHGSPNRARHAMNTALMAIGIYKPQLREQAIAAARKIGKVEVDHGATSCKTPDAESYIRRAAQRPPRKTRKKAARSR